MYEQCFGTDRQIKFADEHEYYRFLGYWRSHCTDTALSPT